ncbi:hypothetical protein AB0K52_23655 [Glycomyces sp. NPDC049804]|uniref:hypothetical protein n=1 Tax=Glycomyces sp. NPDC049804 TaxID=3154363 RepID=UPI003423A792
MALAVAGQLWPLLLFVSLALGTAAAWAAGTGDTTQLPLAGWIFAAAVAGLTASFTLHECAHAAVLGRIATVSEVSIERTLGRVSLIPHGHMTGRQAAAVAVSGPVACAAVGAVLAVPEATRPLSWWYLGHGLFLLPVFGDGIALVKGLLAGSRRIDLAP